MEVVETPSYPTSFKVHCMMCTELRKFVDRITKIFPDIEAARPRCSSGIKALCSLNGAIDRAKLLLQYCSESSKLYLAIRTDAIVSRCRKTKNLLEQCLCHIQSMVPVKLADEISQIVGDLRAANFFPDKFEEEAGKVVRELLQRRAAAPDSIEYAEMKALQTAASRLHITSPKAISIEKESIKKLLEKISDGDQQKKKILKYLLYMLSKYPNLIIGVQTDNTRDRNEGAFAAHTRSADVKSHSEYKQYDARAETSNRATIPPEEFKCPLSSRLMYDPVVIASGQTFERTWIQKWFDDGNETCPKTEMKLDHLSLTPNASLKVLVTEWCRKYGITMQDTSMQPDVLPSLENSSTSISTFGSSMNDLRFLLDISNKSLGSLDTSYTSDGSRNRTEDGSSLMPEKTSDDLRRYRSLRKTAETELECLSGLAKMIEDIKNHLKCVDLDCLHLSSKNFIEPLIRFLSSADDLHDIRARRAGFQLLSTLLSKNRNGTRYLSEDAYCMLSSFIGSEVTREVLDIMLVLSEHSSCGSKIYASGALVSMLNMLELNIKVFQEQILEILRNLSSSTDICSELVFLECIPKLVPYLQDTTLARHCIVLLRNLCSIQEARTWITQTSGCIASIATLLEAGDHENQEHALAILLTLCSESIGYCHLVMDECSIFPLLFFISANGSEKGKASAMELLRQLRDTKHDNGDDDEHECSNSNNIESEECSNSNNIESEDANVYSKDKMSCNTLFGVKLPKFSRTSAPKKKK
ncbi:U-box domain-containing protein 5-like isoform X2 [Hibiscus syriacus]|uniref:U-box domain-containing protein 5-like isoform X2 n=1 Tax=Hibiscus syriacus TaxID=106335 RepID=UPI001924A525|nr:U-box domain-containing protein 5-like isoform X2 [Hibiscus syriacus]